MSSEHEVELNDLRHEAHLLEERMDRNNDQFIADMVRIRVVQQRIDELTDLVWWRRFIEFCNTSCWRYRVTS